MIVLIRGYPVKSRRPRAVRKKECHFKRFRYRTSSCLSTRKAASRHSNARRPKPHRRPLRRAAPRRENPGLARHAPRLAGESCAPPSLPEHAASRELAQPHREVVLRSRSPSAAPRQLQKPRRAKPPQSPVHRPLHRPLQHPPCSPLSLPPRQSRITSSILSNCAAGTDFGDADLAQKAPSSSL